MAVTVAPDPRADFVLHGGWMTLDDVYGPEHDRFPLEQERTPAARVLDWNDSADWQGLLRRTPRGRALDALSARAPLAVLLQTPRRAA